MHLRSLVACVFLLACAPTQPSGLVLDGVLTLDEDCIVDDALPLRGEGVLDTSALPTLRPDGVTYRAAFRFLDYEREAQRYPRLAIPYETSLDDLVVEIRCDGVTLDMGTLPNPFVVPLEGNVGFPADADEPARGVGAATVVPAAYVAAIDSTLPDGGDLELRIHAMAHRPTGAMLTSTTLVYPLRVCVGCLVTCAASGVAATAACAAGQDDPSSVHCE